MISAPPNAQPLGDGSSHFPTYELYAEECSTSNLPSQEPMTNHGQSLQCPGNVLQNSHAQRDYVQRNSPDYYIAQLESMLRAKEMVAQQSSLTISMLTRENEKLRRQIEQDHTVMNKMRCEMQDLAVGREQAYRASSLKESVEGLVAFILDDTRTIGGMREKLEGLLKENTHKTATIDSLRNGHQELEEQLRQENLRIGTLKDTILFLQDKMEKGQQVSSSPLKEFVDRIANNKPSTKGAASD